MITMEADTRGRTQGGLPVDISRRGHTLSTKQILDATESCFAECGYDGTTIRAIAKRLDCSVGSIYRYFHDKRELLLTCGYRLLEPVLAQLQAGGSFEQSVQTYIDCATNREELYRLQFWLAPQGRCRLPDVVDEILLAWSKLLGSHEEAELQWCKLHGMLLLGGARDRGTLLHSARHAELQHNPHSPQVVTRPIPSAFAPGAEDVTLL